MPRTLQKSFWLLKLLFVKEAFDPIRKGPPLWNFGISYELYFFQGNEIILRGKKCTALFQTHNWEKSSRVKRLKFWKSGFLAQKSPNITQNLGRKIVIYSSFWIGMAYIVAWYILFHLIAREVAIIYAFLTWYMSNSLKVVQQVCSFMEGFQQKKSIKMNISP